MTFLILRFTVYMLEFYSSCCFRAELFASVCSLIFVTFAAEFIKSRLLFMIITKAMVKN